MAFQKWEYTKPLELEAASAPIETGLRTLKIDNAFYDPEKYQYTLEVEDIENGSKFSLRYWLQNVEKEITNGMVFEKLTPNKTSNGTMCSLGKALYGDDYDPERDGILAPVDVLGRVVIADVKLGKPAANGVQYPRVYRYMMAYEADSWASEGEQKFRA